MNKYDLQLIIIIKIYIGQDSKDEIKQYEKDLETQAPAR